MQGCQHSHCRVFIYLLNMYLHDDVTTNSMKVNNKLTIFIATWFGITYAFADGVIMWFSEKWLL